MVTDPHSRLFSLFRKIKVSKQLLAFTKPHPRPLATAAGIGLLLLVLLLGARPDAAAGAAPNAPAGPANGAISIEDIVFNPGQSYGHTVKKYPSTVYRRGDTFDITLTLEGDKPVYIYLEILGPAGYTSLFDTISCFANDDGLAICNQGTKSLNGYIEWISWNRFRVTLVNPTVKDVLIGNYKVKINVVSKGDSSDEKDSLQNFSKKFAVIFNPYDANDEVYRPDDDVRRAYVYSQGTGAAAREEYGVWYYAYEWRGFPLGSWRTEGYQKTFALRPFSPQIFDKMITLLDALELKKAEDAYKVLATYVEDHLDADPSAVQSDVTQLTAPGTNAQCASQANYLVAHLRSAGIPSMPIYVDANKWDKVNWNFHTWVEAWMNNKWLVADPFNGKITPTTRKALGASGAAYDQDNNDLIGFGDVNWTAAKNNRRVYRAIFDGPNPMMKGGPESFFATVHDTFLEESILYWPGGANPSKKSIPNNAVDTAATNAAAAMTGVEVEVTTDQTEYEVGETIGITATLTNSTNAVMTVPLSINLDGDYILTKSPVDSTMVVYDQIEIVPPQGQIVIPLTAAIPADARTDYSYRVTADTGTQTDAATIDVAALVELVLSLPACFRPNQPFEVQAIVSNSAAAEVNNVTLELALPSFFTVQETTPLTVGTLAPGESTAATFTVTPAGAGIAPLAVEVSSTNGGGFESPVTITSMCPLFLPMVINN